MQHQENLKAPSSRFLWQRPLSFLGGASGAGSNLSPFGLRPDLSVEADEEADEEEDAEDKELRESSQEGFNLEPDEQDDDGQEEEPEVEEEIEIESTNGDLQFNDLFPNQPLDLKLNNQSNCHQLKTLDLTEASSKANKSSQLRGEEGSRAARRESTPVQQTIKAKVQSDTTSKTYSNTTNGNRSSLGKSRRLYKCRHCNFVTEKKVENWQHIRIHMRPEKLLACESCQFVTEYKHHLEYHQRNHSGYKPFNCDHCDYKCVNKSMLNSHMKSHSSVYQYQCGDCRYATKYVHSLKMHLRKYNHQPTQLMIDVYGRRRGPKSTSSSSCSPQQTQQQDQQQCILDLRVDSKLIQ